MPTVTRLYLIRHGATMLTAEDRFAGATNVALSEEGRMQAAALADRLKSVKLEAIYASPLDRTMETASILAAPQHLAVQPVDGLREISHGHWEGMTRAEVLAAFPEEVAAWDEDPYTFAPAGAESGLAVTARALPPLMEIYAAHRGGHVAIVSHKATIRLVISSMLGFDPRRYRDNLDQSPCALNIVDVRGPICFRLILFNDTSHYTREAGEIAAMPGNRLSPHWSVSNPQVTP
jgi:broad specificity phosphatase PhoE